jgi:hypothetical protein
MPVKDRLLYRSETAARVRWSRDGESVALMLAGREQDPEGVSAETHPGPIFDPTSDRLYFGHTWHQEWFAHPLADGSEELYRYRSGDTLVVRLPDGRAVRAIAVSVSPRRPSFRYLSSILWIEPASGALVRAVFRPARRLDVERDSLVGEDGRDGLRRVPGVFKPMEFDIESVVIEYSLWSMKHWLPRSMRLDGSVRAGVLRLAFSAETSYDIETLAEEGDSSRPEPTAAEVIAGWNPASETRSRTIQSDDRSTHIYYPTESGELMASADLPPPIWENAPGFATEAELESFARQLDALARVTASGPARVDLRWGLSRADLVRYNRVEGLSVGGMASVEQPGLGDAQATVRLGTADLHPNLELRFARPGLRRTPSLRFYHQLDAVEGQRNALGLGGSLGALFLGRDDGEYYRATGATLALSPPDSRRGWVEWRFFAERQRAVELGTEWSVAHLLGGDPFRPNFAADPADLVGIGFSLAPWWGQDPAAPQAGLDLLTEGAVGDFEFARARLTARAAVPLGGRYRTGLELGGGSSWGTVPLQYSWFLGGPSTLRGYGGSAAVGSSFLRARAELARGSPMAGIAVFGDAAWAGDRSDFAVDDALVAAGIGASLMEGLLRVDLARALRQPVGWRLEIYLDAPF